MTAQGRNQRLDLLVLARVAGAGGSSRISPSKVHEAVDRFAGPDLSPTEQRRAVHERITDLVDRGLLTTRPLQVTDEGHKWLCDGLGVDQPPPWATVRNRLAPMLALGLQPGSKEAQQAFASTEVVQALVIARRFAPQLTRPTLAQVLNALTAQALGTRRPVRSSSDLRPLLTEQWVDREHWAPTGATEAAQPADEPPAEQHHVADPEALNLDEFALVVRDAAAREEDGRFGDRKVFISALHRRLSAQDPRVRAMTSDAFKARLIEANARRLLTLARADYVAAMDPEEVAASHVHDLGADFHFVLDEGGR